MLTGRKYRLALTSEQSEYAEAVGSACRSVWNTALAQRRMYRERRAWISYQEQARQLADAKTDHPWLKDAPAHCLQQVLMDLDKACKLHGTRRVCWRSFRRWSPSFRFPEGGKVVVERLNRRWGRVKLPKFGWVRFRWTRGLGGVVRSATVSRDGNRWYISFLVDTDAETPQQHDRPGMAIGVDRGVSVAVACSDGRLMDRINHTAGERKRYQRLERRLARQQRKGSANRRKAGLAKRAIKRRERNRRKDFCAQAAAVLARNNALIVLEDLKITSMTKSARGTVAGPGRNVAQKAALNRAILEKGWYGFELALRSAARWTGTRIVKVPAAYTSQTCSRCRGVDPESRESQAVFRCTSCGHSENADVNAARNILAAGLAGTACGDLAAGRSVKQEPAGTREVLPLQPV